MTLKHPFSTRRGRALRLRKLTMNPFCEVPGCGAPAVQVHHVVPLHKGGHPTAWANLKSVCATHHSTAHGGKWPVGADGWPGDPNHDWNRR